MEGLRYVFGHPVLRNISLMMMLVNFAGVTVYTQRVLYAKEQLGASDTEVAIFMAAGGAGVARAAAGSAVAGIAVACGWTTGAVAWDG